MMKNKMVVLGLCAVVGSLFSSVVPGCDFSV